MPLQRAVAWVLLAGTLGLAGCIRVGPDFQSPREPWVVDRSTTTGAPSLRGKPNAIGFVPKIGLVPPHGATQAEEGWPEHATRPTWPSRAAAST